MSSPGRGSITIAPAALPAALAVVLAADVLILRRRSRLVAGLIDETAHLATGVIALGAARSPVGRRFAAGLVAGSVLLDIDHLPELAGSDWLRPGRARPRPHALVTPLAGVIAALALHRPGRVSQPRSDAALGAVAGLGSHLLRDLGTGGGVALLWPVSRKVLRIPYAAYLAVLVALVRRRRAR